MWTKELPKNGGFYFYIDRLTKEKMIVEVSIEEDRFTMWKHGNELPLNFNYAIGGLFWSDPIVFPDTQVSIWLKGKLEEDIKNKDSLLWSLMNTKTTDEGENNER